MQGLVDSNVMAYCKLEGISLITSVWGCAASAKKKKPNIFYVVLQNYLFHYLHKEIHDVTVQKTHWRTEWETRYINKYLYLCTLSVWRDQHAQFSADLIQYHDIAQ